MKNPELWRPSIVERKGSHLVPTKRVGVHSWMAMTAVARWHERNLAKHISGRLVDLGCGEVPYYGFFRGYVSDWICVDWANSMHQCPHLDYEWDLTRPLPFEDGWCDTVLLLEVLEHHPKPNLMMKEVSRILRKGGKVILSVPFYYPLHEEPNDYYRYTRHALISMANEVGLDVVQLDERGGIPEIIADIGAKCLINLPIVGNIAAAAVQRLFYCLASLPLGNRFSKATGRGFPLGYMMVCVKA